MADTPKIEQWPVVRKRVDSLVAYERNPRKLAPAAYERLRQSIVENGYVAKVIATHDGKIIGGHVRIHALKALGVEEIDVIQAPGPISEDHYKRLLLIDNIHAGEFDTLLLQSDFGLEELKLVGLPDDLLKEIDLDEKPKKHKQVTDATEYTCLVEFPTEAEQEKFHEEMQQRGISCRLMS